MQGSSAEQGNFRPSPNFSAGATRAPVQLLPPWFLSMFFVKGITENLSKLIWFENPELEKISLEQNVDVDHGQGQWSKSEKGG